MENKLPKLIVIVGPTASGKTSLAIEIAKQVDGEVVSADSRQFYKGMNIGTGKITREEMQGIPHHLIDFLNPDEPFSLADFQVQAIETILDIIRRGKVPILVGGTGLYTSAVIENYELSGAEPDKELREELSSYELTNVQDILRGLDPDSSVDWDNKRRVIRAIERIKSGGAEPKKGKPLFDYLLLSPVYDREQLYTKIDQRVDSMISGGLLEEVRELAARYSWDLPSMSGIGYRQFKDCLEGKEILEDSIEKLKRDTRHYAKRQITWFRRYQDQVKIVSDSKEAIVLVKQFMDKKG